MYNLILVGGTGKQFGSILGWLNQVGLIVPPSKLLVVDADISGYAKVISGLSYANPNFVSEHVRPYHHVGASLNILSEMQLSDETSPLLSLSFSEEEKLLNIKDGFYGNPKLGATVFGHHQQTTQNGLISSLSAVGARISNPTFIVGSVSGGTGAGLMYSIAKLCSMHSANRISAPVIGVVFSKYTTVDDSGDIISNVKLQENSYNGISFLWNKFNQNKAEFAFDVVNVIGPPVSDTHPQFCVNAVANGEINSFPGFLIAAQMFRDGGEDIRKQNEASILADARSLGIATYAGRASIGAKQHYVHARDIYFTVNNSNSITSTKVTVDELITYLKTIRNVLEEIIFFPMEEVVSMFSVFPLRKLPKELVRYLFNMNGKNKISKTTLLHTYTELKSRAETLIATLLDSQDSFIQWLNTLSAKGLEFGPEQESSNKIQFTSWLDATPSISIDANSHGKNTAIDLMLKGICTNQIYTTALDLIPPPASQNIWLLPYLNHPLPSKLGWTPIETSLYQLNSIEINSETGSCYPTVLGRAEVFGQKLKQALSTVNYQNTQAFQETERLWCGLAMGILRIRPLKLNSTQTSNLEKLIGKFENQTVIPLIEDLKGNVVGACHPEYGLWSGVNALFTGELIHVTSDFMKKNEAKSILKTWFDDITITAQALNYTDMTQKLWYRFLAQLLIDAHPINYDKKQFDLGAHAPLLLNVTTISGVIVEKFYPYFYSPYRKVIREHLVSSIGQINNSKLNISYNSQSGILDIYHPLIKKVASLYIGSNSFIALNNVDVALQEGCLTVIIDNNYPLDVIEPVADTSVGLINKLGNQGVQVQSIYLNANTKPNVLKPELLWT